MYNKSILMGRICNDLELKITPSGKNVVTLRLAVERSYQVKGEERKTDFFNIVAWRNNAEFICRYFSKGRMILVEGELQIRQYVDRNNITQNIVELVVNNVHFTGEPKAAASSNNNSSPNVPSSAAVPAENENAEFEETSDDDYPF